MFFCQACKDKRNWPVPWHGLFSSHGPCEVCGVTSDCYEVPSAHLPLPDPEPTQILTEADVINGTEPF